jgi:UDP-glucose 4-epimerase
MRVVVTGGAGFIGSNLVLELLGNGDVVLVVDDLSVGSADNLDPRAEFARLDILSDRLPALFAEFRPEAVVHLAAQASVAVSVREPEFDRRVNVEGTRAVAAAARDAGARLVLSASSAAVYGEPVELPLTEDAEKTPVNPYGASKLAAESVLANELEGSGTDHASLRFANVYGPRQDIAGEGGVVAFFMAAAVEGTAPMVFGDGEQTRDFIYVGDVVGAIGAAIASPSPLAAHGPAFNVSTGRASSVNDLLGEVKRVTGYGGSAEYLPAREGDIRDSLLDPSRARAAFGWQAQTDLRAGISATWEWWEARG